MSTTVSYKGNNIATVANNTKTLTTAGKYLEANIILTDVSGGGGNYQTKTQTFTPSASQQTATITPDSGYDALDEVDVTVDAIAPPFYDMSGPLAWLGVDVQTIATDFYSKVDTLDNTPFATWTPSTTALAVVPSTTLTAFSATELDQYGYYIIWECGLDPVYTGTPTKKALPQLARAVLIQYTAKRPANWDKIVAGECNATANQAVYNSSFLRYYGTTTGTSTYTYGASYGFYFAQTAPTISSTTATTTNITPKTPTLSARCNATYMSTTNASLVDAANSKWWIKGKAIYKVKRDELFDGIYKAVCAAINATPPDLPTP